MPDIDKNGFAIISKDVIKYYQDKAYRTANIPVAYDNLTIDDFSTTQDHFGHDLTREGANKKEKAKEVVTNYMAKMKDILFKNASLIIKAQSGEEFSSRHLLFHGGPSSGKTMLMTSLLKEAIQYSKTVEYFDWPSLIATIARFEKAKEIDILKDKFRSYDIIGIDNISKYQLDRFAKLNLDALLSERKTANKPTLFGSYIHPMEIVEMIGIPAQRFFMETIIINLPSAEKQDFMVIN